LPVETLSQMSLRSVSECNKGSPPAGLERSIEVEPAQSSPVRRYRQTHQALATAARQATRIAVQRALARVALIGVYTRRCITLAAGSGGQNRGQTNVRRMLLAAAVLLTGCVSPYAKLYSEIPQYQGRNIDALVDRIGYPDSQTFMSGRIIYSWTAAVLCKWFRGQYRPLRLRSSHSNTLRVAANRKP
jgi:hypothetical protein